MRDAYPANRTSLGPAALGLGPVVAAMARRFVPELARRAAGPASLSATDGPARLRRFLPPAAGGPARRARRRPARAAAAALAALLALVCLCAGVTSASAQTATALVSNLGQTASSNASSAINAQPFTTGTNTAGYGLTSVEIALGSTSGNDGVLVRIVPNGATDRPDFSDTSKIVTLTNPASITDRATNTFTAPADSTLDASTTYHVVVSGTNGNEGPETSVRRTTSDSEDTGKATGWSIGDSRYWRNSSSDSWTTSSEPAHIRINGTITTGGGTTASCGTPLTREIWCGVLSAGSIDESSGLTSAGYDSSTGQLTPNTFTFGQTGYTVRSVARSKTFGTAGTTLSDSFAISVTPSLSATVAGAWELRVGTASLAFADAAFTAGTISGVAGITVSWSSHSSTLAAGDSVAVRIIAGALAAPANLEATPGDGQVALSWDAPASDSGVTRHEYRYKAEGGSYPSTWTEIPNSAAGGANEDGVTVSGLTNGTVYTFQVRAVDAVGEGASAESTDVTPYSTDATLSALTLADGTTNIVLNPAFASGTRNYAAVVANSVDSVTVSATTSHASARFDLLDANDEEIDDADANRSGYQVSLDTGTNTIKVKVTAEDGSTTRTYRLRVTRLTATGGGTGSCATTLPDEIWCATLTVGTGSRTVSGVTINYTGFRNLTGLNVGGLDPDSFEYQGDTYTVPGVFLVTSAFIDDVLGLSLDPVPTGANAGRWILYVGTTAYELPQATNLVDNGQPTFTWTDLPSWSDGETVTVRLTAPSTDATLSGLTLTDGTTNVPLTPAFASATTGYTASVANSVTQITVTPEPNDGGASYELLDASGMAISDADSSTLGDQVMLSVGANIIKVKVTAADGTTGTYTVTVTRSQGPAVVLEPTVLHIAEGGSGSYTVKLNSAPTGTVTVLLTVTGDTDVTVQPSVLSFTTSDWATPQPVTVTAGEDGDDDTDTATVAHQPYGGGYDGLVGSVRVTVSDAEGSGVGRLQLAGDLETGEEVVNGETVPYTKGRLEIWMRGALNPDSNRWEASYGGTVLAGAAQGTWGTVCDDRFRQPDNRAADVACKILGYEGGAYAGGYGSNMSLAEKPIWLDDLRCLAGTPSHRVDDPRSLLDCNHGGRGYHNCSHREDVGVKCTGMLGTPVDSGPELRAATLVDDRQAVLLTFDEPLDADNLPPTGAFRVFVVDHNDDTRLVTGLGAPAENPLQLRLDLHKPVPGGMEVKVIYDDPTRGDDGEAIQDGDGNDAHAFRVVTESGSASTAEDGPLSDEAETGLAAEFKDLPASHDGEAPFTFELALSEEIEGLSWVTVRDSVLDVSGGRVTQARRLEAPSNRRWAVTVEPGGDGEISIALPPTTDCEAEGALCTADGRMLANGRATLVPGPQAAPAPEPEADLTVRFESVPDTHDGESPVVFRLAFSEEPASDYSYKTMRDRTLNVWQGARLQVREAKRLSPPSNRRWQVTVEPASKADITVGLGPTFDCADNGAVCTGDGRKLANPLHKVIKGPPGISVADARVDEAADATVDFAVTLSRAASETVTVDYATADGTATAGSDYTATSGALTFAPGETAKTVSVPVLDDAHDEGSETFTLTLSNASGGGAWLKDATATGTIENDDPMPQAWLARFGRTVAEQVIEAVEGRLSASRTPGVEMTLAGERIGSASGFGTAAGDDLETGTRAAAARQEREAQAKMTALSDWLRDGHSEDGGTAGYRSRTVSQRDLLVGSSFSVTGEANAGGVVSLWGRGALSRFDGREGDLSLDGEVTSAMIGADWRRDVWTAGLLVSHSRGEGGYRGPEGGGTVSSSVTGLYPYGRYMVNQRVTLWGVAGYGEGTLTLTPENPVDGEDDRPIRTGMDLMMGALGVRGVVVEAPPEGGPELAVKSDAMAVSTSSEKTDGLAAARGDVTRLRLGLEGTWRGIEAGGGALTPRAEIGVRHDGGDAETGFGLDVGGGLAWTQPANGIAAEVSGRALLTHEAKGFRDRGIAGSLAWDPGRGSGRGPKLTLTQTMGASAAGGVDALLGRGTLGGLGANDDGDELANRRLELRLGYGLSAFGDRFTATPELGLALSNGHRDYSLGWRLNLAQRGVSSLELKLEATRREKADGAANDNDAEHGIGFRVTARW